MGKQIIAQRKGKGSPAYASPSHRFFGKISYLRSLYAVPMRGQVVDFIDDPGHGPLLAEVLLENSQKLYTLAPEGLKKGDEIKITPQYNAEQLSVPQIGSIVPLGSLPEGTPIYNIELRPGDGGKIARASGAVAYVAGRDDEKQTVQVRLASKAIKTFLASCFATIGVASGGGKKEKPFKTAGNHMRAMLAVGREWPHVRRSAMSAYSHPFGGKSFGKPTTVSRNTPPGRKVGHIAARRTGRKRGMSSDSGNTQQVKK